MAPEGTTFSSTWIRSDEMNLALDIAQANLAHANSVQNAVVPRKSLYTRFGKRLLDIALSGLALIVTSPVNLVILIVTYLDLGAPVLFKQRRTGKDLAAFELVKFRNMTNERDENGELLPPQMRVTETGRKIRKYSLDELLNFWSVFKGDMSLIGPRPLPVEYNERLSERHKMRYAVRPGLECPLTKSIKEKYPFPEPYSRYHAQFENDVWYVENVSLSVDIQLAFSLGKMVFDMGHRSKTADAASPFIGYDEDGCAVSVKQWGIMNSKRCEEGGRQ